MICDQVLIHNNAIVNVRACFTDVVNGDVQFCLLMFTTNFL